MKLKNCKSPRIKIKNVHVHINQKQEDVSDWVLNEFPFGNCYLPREVSDYFQQVKDERDKVKKRLENLIGKQI
jgi:hypothetical protein